MISECAVCGSMFEAKTIRAKYCCRKCSNHSRFIQTKDERKETIEIARKQALDLFDSNLSADEIAKIINKSSSFVRHAWYEAGKPRRTRMTPYQEQVAQLRQQGLCCSEIAERLNVDCRRIRNTVKAIGMPFTEDEVSRSIQYGKEKAVKNQYGTVDERIKYNIDTVTEKHPNFEYVSGWISGDRSMILRCKECGNEVVKSAITVRKGNHIQCPYCEEKKRELKHKEIEILKQIKKEEKQKNKEYVFWNQSFEQTNISVCPECGAIFYGKRKYCSDDCMRKINNARRKDKRIRNIQELLIDKDINIQKLYDRDKGKCWICGGVCDFNDFYRDQNNNFIVGGNYPSIDHIFPLSKGGLHSWDNIKLAHHYCNSVKSNKVVSL